MMRFGFVTCVQLGLSCMEAIYRIGGRLDLAVTLPDDRAAAKSGRIHPDEFCARHGIRLVKSPNVNDPEVVEAILAAELDWLFIIGWSQIARAQILAAPKRGVLGMHPSLLPVGRGRAAIPWAILKRLDETGVTLFKLDGGVDTGDILDQLRIPLTPAADATALYAAVEAGHISLMERAFPRLVEGTIEPVRQDESRATIWPGRKPEDGEIDLAGAAADAELLVRAVTRPYPGAFFIRDGRKTVVWKADLLPPGAAGGAGPLLAFGDGVLRLLEWQDAGPA